MADAKHIIKIILLLSGEQAARVRTQASEVFVRFLGGDASLVQEVMQNRDLQDSLRKRDPEHWARLFGEHVEAAEAPVVTDGVSSHLLTTLMIQTINWIGRK